MVRFDFLVTIGRMGLHLTRCKLRERGVSDAPVASCFTCTSLHNDKLTTKTSFNVVELLCGHSANELKVHFD